jgi:hypothetical protein
MAFACFAQMQESSSGHFGAQGAMPGDCESRLTHLQPLKRAPVLHSPLQSALPLTTKSTHLAKNKPVRNAPPPSAVLPPPFRYSVTAALSMAIERTMVGCRCHAGTTWGPSGRPGRHPSCHTADATSWRCSAGRKRLQPGCKLAIAACSTTRTGQRSGQLGPSTACHCTPKHAHTPGSCPSFTGPWGGRCWTRSGGCPFSTCAHTSSQPRHICKHNTNWECHAFHNGA